MKKIPWNFGKIDLSDIKLRELWLKIRRGVLYGLYLVGALLLQNVVFSHIAIFGVKAMFLPALVVAVAMFEGGWFAGCFGIAAGMLSDLFFSSQTWLFTALFPILGFAAGFLADFYLNRRLFTYAAMAVVALFISAVAQAFGLIFYQGQSSGAVWGTVFLQTLWSIPFLFPSYYLCRAFPWPSNREIPSPYK